MAKTNVTQHARSFWEEFREFALQGNLIDLAIGIVLGTAFKEVTSSFVSDIIMPPIGLVIGRVDFSNLYINLSRTEYASLAEAQLAGAPTINYGLFLTQVIDFLLTALSLYIVLRFLFRYQVTKREK
jgi:large conductance mechanosensitive channel